MPEKSKLQMQTYSKEKRTCFRSVSQRTHCSFNGPLNHVNPMRNMQMVLFYLLRFYGTSVIFMKFVLIIIMTLVREDAANNFSMIYIAKKTPFCEAHKGCFELGLTKGRIGMMVGNDFYRLVNHYNITSNLWVNINALLHPTSQAYGKNWIDGENESMFSAGSIDLAETTNVNESYRVLYSNEKMELVRTNTVSGAYAYGCDFGPKIRRDLYVSQERFVNEIRNLSEMRADTDVTEGCFIRHTGFTLIGCAIT